MPQDKSKDNQVKVVVVRPSNPVYMDAQGVILRQDVPTVLHNLKRGKENEK